MECAGPGVRLTFAEPLNRVMKVLLITFAALFVLPLLIPPLAKLVAQYLLLDTSTFLKKWYLWQPFTAIFFHGSPCHFIGNMVFFWFFGSSLANAWSDKEFLKYFFLCGIVGSLCFLGLEIFRHGMVGCKGLGASGAIFGLMAAYAMTFGERTILAFFLIPMKAKHFVWLAVGMEILLLFAGTEDGVLHVAHVGGGLFGAAYLKWTRSRSSNRPLFKAPGKKPARTSSRIGGLEVMDDD